MSLIGRINDLASRVAAEFNSVRETIGDVEDALDNHTHIISDISNLQATLDSKAAASHTHAASDTTTGTFDIARLPIAASGVSNATTVVRADDSRLSNARPPTAHTHAIADITNLQSLLDGKAAASHTHGATQITSGTFDIARIPTGTTSTTVALGNHTHTPASIGAASATHTHAIADVTNLQTTLDGKASSSHTHTAANITSGTFDIARIPVAASGTSSTTQVVRADDTRLYDSRTPVAHTHAIADVAGLSAALGFRFGAGDVITNGPFWTSKNLYFSDLHDVMFRAEQRWTVVGTIHSKATDAVLSTLTMSQVGMLFNNNHDAGITIPAGNYLKLSITFDKTNSGTFPGYPYGDFYWTHYHTSHTESVQARVYTTYVSHGPGWKTLPVEDVVRSSTVLVQKADNTFYQITNAEFTFAAPDDASAQVVSLMWFLDRPTIATEQPYVGKYKTEYLYNKLIWRDGLGNSVGSIDTTGVVDFPIMRQSGVALVRTDDSRLSDARTPTAHTHTKSQITDFTHTHTIADLPVATSGTSSSTQLVRADDSRLSDARTPIAHGHALTDSNITGILPIAQIPTGTTASTVALGNHTHTPASIGAAAASHTHAIGDLPVATSGTSSSTQLVRADDSRLSNARTPTTHTHAATDVTSGTFNIARIPTGTTSTTVALGDHTHTISNISGLQDALDAAGGDSIIRKAKWHTTVNHPLSGLDSLYLAMPLSAGDRVLVRRQINQAQNGIYVASAGAWTRATDFDSPSDIYGTLVFVEEGLWSGLSRTIFPSTGVVGTTNITFDLLPGEEAIVTALNGKANTTHTHPEFNAVVPTGAMLDFAGSTAPTGFLLCDGAAVSRTTYSALFAVIGTTYGAGNGSTTFNVPDSRMRTSLGGPSAGYALGASDSVAATSRFPYHGHSLPAHTHTATTSVASYINDHLVGASSSGVTGSAGGHSHTAASAGAHTHTTGTPSNSPVNTWSISGNSGTNSMPRAAQYDAHTHTAASAGAHTHSTDTTGAHTHTIPGHSHSVPMDHTHTATTSINSALVLTDNTWMHYLVVNKIIKI